tara:strand:- start:4828 stop:6381 length:1554 start_codon:yes stop_codon:yes gene_type:complete
MKDLLTSLLEQLKNTNQQTRVVILAGFVALLAVVGFSTYRANNPHMAFFRGDLDPVEFNNVTSALGKAGIRFDTSTGGAPYSVWVDSTLVYEARTAIATEGALNPGTRGISTNGASSAFDASMERTQKANARYWQEIEKQLEVLSWVSGASVRAAMPTRTILGKRPQPTVSVVLTTRGSMRPSQQQARDVYSIVQHSFNVPMENVTITDHHGVALLDNDPEKGGLEGMLAFESSFETSETRRAQAWLDDTYGPGISKVSVIGEWAYERIEEVGETIDDKGKPVSEATLATSTPSPSPVGGPAGVTANNNGAPAPSPTVEPATKDETTKTFAYGSKTTHTVRTEPQLQRLSISLAMDESRAADLESASSIVKSLAGYLDGRDTFSSGTIKMFGLERDESGNPIAPTAMEMPSAPNPMVTMMFERGLEILAAGVFLFLLLRTLKKSRSPAEQLVVQKRNEVEQTKRILEEGDGLEIKEIDPALLGRRTVENLIDEDPERVSALLSRWAMGEDFYETTKS